MEEGLVNAPLLLQYKFVNAVEEHELMILDDQKKSHFIRVTSKEANNGIIVNLPLDRQYALASLFIIVGKTKKELQFGRDLPAFKLSQDKLTRIRGFDIINDKQKDVNSVSIAPWDGVTDNLVLIQAAKKFKVPESSIRTINIFKK